MITLVGTPEKLAMARDSLKSSGFAYAGPDTLGDGTDIIAALDRVIRTLSDIPPKRISKMAFVKVDPADIFASSAVLQPDHWLRRFWQQGGFSLSAPAPRKMMFAR